MKLLYILCLLLTFFSAVLATEEALDTTNVSEPVVNDAAPLPKPESVVVETTPVSIANNQIENNQVLVFLQNGCVDCDAVRDLLYSKKIFYHVFSFGADSFSEEMKDYLFQKTGANTIPLIFVNGNFLGGFSDLEKTMNDGELEEMLSKSYPPK